jgi:hypothetical protein
MKLQDFISQLAREAGLPMENEREAHIYAQSVMPAGTADIEITPNEEALFRPILLRVMQKHLQNPKALDEKVMKQIASN